MDCEKIGSQKIEFDIPADVRKICRILQENGEVAVLVGGSVRDLLLGVSPGDFDLATSARPERVMQLFRRVIPTGIEHGTVTVMLGKIGYEITTLRSEQGYSDGRHPDTVKYVTNITEDLSRRDFTVNAIAWDPITHALNDPFDGRGDLQRRCLRAVGDAAVRFTEDGLRIMRAARFAATLEFNIEPRTLAALSGCSGRLDSVSIERKRDELQKMLMARKPSYGLRVMVEHHIFAHICDNEFFNELFYGTATDWEQIYRRLDACSAMLHLRFAALFQGMENRPLQNWLDRFLIDKRTKKQVLKLCSLWPLPYSRKWSDGDTRRFLSNIGKEKFFDYLALLHANIAAESIDRDQVVGFEERVDALDGLNCPLTIAELAVSGADLVSILGLSPGPRIGELLSELREIVLESPAENTRDKLLARARRAIADN